MAREPRREIGAHAPRGGAREEKMPPLGGGEGSEGRDSPLPWALQLMGSMQDNQGTVRLTCGQLPPQRNRDSQVRYLRW